MIGLDTNVLVRYFMFDDAQQSAQAVTLIDTLTVSEKGFVSLVVISELVWVLNYVFQLSRDEVNDTLSQISRMPVLSLENFGVFLKALALCSNSSLDFVDCLIGCLAAQAGCSYTATFDRKAARLPGMVRIR